MIYELTIQGATLKKATQKAQFKKVLLLYFLADTLLMTQLAKRAGFQSTGSKYFYILKKVHVATEVPAAGENFRGFGIWNQI